MPLLRMTPDDVAKRPEARVDRLPDHPILATPLDPPAQINLLAYGDAPILYNGAGRREGVGRPGPALPGARTSGATGR